MAKAESVPLPGLVALCLVLSGVGCGATAEGPLDGGGAADQALARDATLAPDLAPPPPTVFLNHLYAVLDVETAAALPAATWLADTLAGATMKTTSGGGKTWTGFYLFGRETYLELFTPGGVAGPAGECAMGFGVETPGAVDDLASREADAGRDFFVGDQTYSTGGGNTIPWFHLGSHFGTPVHLTEWVMEYRPEYMAYALGDPGHDPADIKRRSALSKFYRADRLLDNVRSVTFAVAPSEVDGFAAVATAYGWPVRKEGATTIAEGPEVTLRLLPDASHRGLTELTLRLARAAPTRMELPIGHSTLIVGAGTDAVWRFTPIDVP